MTMQDPSSVDSDFMAFANLHDVFLNATMCRSNMFKAPVVTGVEEFLMSDRGRFERMWGMFLYVLVEAWRSSAMCGARSYIAARAPISAQRIDRVIADGEKNGDMEKMRRVRDYMCHRDKRAYWDAGRVEVAGQSAYHQALSQAFGTAFLDVVKYDNCDQASKGIVSGDNP